jgi:hypothetical protein
VCEHRFFYRDEQEWVAIGERLKQMPCPHCKTIGTLNRHGSLHGFDDDSPRRKTLRARRIFCSNRGRRAGCGRTFSIWIAGKIRRSSLTTGTLWTFLQRAVRTSLAAAMRVVPGRRSGRSWQRIWQRFDRAQSRIRTALLCRGPPPEGPPGSVRRPDIAQVLAHLQSAFPHADGPFAAYQLATRSFIL